jgi:hypothetical protein
LIIVVAGACGLKGFSDLLGDRQGLVDGDRTLRDAIGERRPLDQLHHESLDPVGFFEAVNRCDVRANSCGLYGRNYGAEQINPHGLV